MLRRLCIVCAAATVALASFVTDSRPAEAQGLLRRIQSRIQERIQAAPDFQAPRATSPPANFNRPQDTPPSRLEPQRVSPMGPEATPGRDGSKANTAGKDMSKFGNSILSGSSDSAAPASKARRGSMGIDVFDANDGVAGVEVVRFRDDSLADEAGLKVGDVIVAIDGKATPDVQAIALQLDGRRAGDELTLQVVRERRSLTLTVPLVPRAVTVAKPTVITAVEAVPGVDPAKFGAATEDVPGVRGTLITEVTPNSPAAVAGIRVGDRMVSVDGRMLVNGDSWRQVLAGHRVGDPMSIQLVRSGKLVSADVVFDDADPVANSSGLATTEDNARASEADSMMEGLGSMLGSLFGGNADSKQKKSRSSEDAMAFDDDEPIGQVGFDSPVETPDLQPKKELDTDPPSLESLKPPVGEPTADQMELPDPTAEQLRNQIRELEERLKELESDVD